jgi:AraC-like DNA-binding protein
MRDQSSALVDPAQDPLVWTTAGLPPATQFERWREIIIDAHLPWDIDGVTCDAFPAFMRQRRFDDFRLTNCSAVSRVHGRRDRGQIGRGGDAYLNVVYIAEGQELLTIDGKELLLTKGMFTLWDSTRPMTFTTGDYIQQITLMIPHERLRRALPGAERFVGVPISAARGLGGLFVDHFLAIERRMGELSDGEASSVLTSTLDLLSFALGAARPEQVPSARMALLRKIKVYIERHLPEPDLDVARIAADHRITVRYLHKLFEETDSTAAGWIRRRRLELCRRDLSCRGLRGRSITEIAFHWGFNDGGHFSKLFKREFGVAPRELRAQASRDER